MKTIATANVPTVQSYSKICKSFGVKFSEVEKPRQIDLLISARSISDHPNQIKSVGKMGLYQGRFGKVLCGTSEYLKG